MAHSIKLTVDHTKIDSDLTNIPIPFNLTTSSGINAFDASALFDELLTSDNRKKIKVFTDDHTTETYAEIEPGYDFSAKKMVLYVLCPFISSTIDQVFYLDFDSTWDGNTVYIGDTGEVPAQAVWDSTFQGVYHMAQDPSGGIGSILDSTSNTNHGTPEAGMVTGDLVDSVIGKGIEFDGTEFIQIPAIAGFSTSAFTIDVLFSEISGDDCGLVSAYRVTGGIDHYGIRLTTNNFAQVFYDNGSSFDSIIGDIDLSSGWYHVAGTYLSGDAGRVYVEGILDATDSSPVSGPLTLTDDFYIARDGEDESKGRFIGLIGEVRISYVDHSASWIKATNYSLHDTLLTMADFVLLPTEFFKHIRTNHVNLRR